MRRRRTGQHRDPGQAPEIHVEPLRYFAGEVVAQKYRLEELLGEGAMGVVWRAHNLALDVDVAVKLIHSEIVSPEAVERLKREAHAAARLEHPSAVRVFDLGETDLGDPFIVMELLRGESLFQYLGRRGQLPPDEAVQLLLPVAGALVAAHAKGIVHRDLKPENIVLVTVDEALVPKVVDFGIAIVDAGARMERRSTSAGEILGSPAYMSPEQARGEIDRVDARTDLWSLAVVLYEMISGKAPFAAKHPLAEIRAIIENEPPTLEAEGYPADLSAIVEKAMRKNLDDRQPDMRSFGRALAQWAMAAGIDADSTGSSIAAVWSRSQRNTTGGRNSVPEAPSSNPGVSHAPASLPVSVPPVSVPPVSVSTPPVPVSVPPISAAPVSAPEPVSVRAPDLAKKERLIPEPRPTPIPLSNPPPPMPAAEPASVRVRPPAVLRESQREPSPFVRSASDVAPSDPIPQLTPSTAVWSPTRHGRSRRNGVAWGIGGALGAGAILTTILLASGPRPADPQPTDAKAADSTTSRVSTSISSVAATTQSAPIVSPVHSASGAGSTVVTASVKASSSAAASSPVGDVNRCVMGLFEANAFEPDADFTSVCAEKEPRKGATRIRAELARHGLLRRITTDSMRMWATLSWYELAAFAVARGTCCPTTRTPMAIDLAIASCPSILPILLEFETVPRPSEAVDQSIVKLKEAVACYEKGRSLNAGVLAPYTYDGGTPKTSADISFKKFLDAAHRAP